MATGALSRPPPLAFSVAANVSELAVRASRARRLAETAFSAFAAAFFERAYEFGALVSFFLDFMSTFLASARCARGSRRVFWAAHIAA